MNGRPLKEAEATPGNMVLPRPKTWYECHDFLGSTIAIFQFLGEGNVTTAFTNARDRITNFLSDPNRFLEIGEAPLSTILAELWMK